MIKYLIKAISTALSFSKTEAKGTLILIFIIVIVHLTSSFYIRNVKKSTMVGSESNKDFAEWVAEVKASHKSKEADEMFVDSRSNQFSKQTRFLTEKKKKVEKNGKTAEKIAERTIIRDINKVEAEELQVIKGIGKVYSNRIVKFRDQLGGFSNMEQLNEVYGITSDLKNQIEKQFEIQSNVIPLSINSDSAKLLVRHPYISYDLAWLIINYRKQHGDIHGIEDLSRIKAIDDSLIQKLRPYIN